MGEAVVDYLVGFVHGLDDAPAEATEGGIELARTLRGGPPEVGGDFDELFAQMQRGGGEDVRVRRTRLPRVHPRRRSVHGGARRVHGAGREPLHQPVAALSGHGPGRAERHPVALRPVRLSRDRPRPPHVRWLHGELLRDRHGAPHARGGLPATARTTSASRSTRASRRRPTSRASPGGTSGWSRPTPSCGWTRMRSATWSAADRAAGFRPFLVVPSAGTTNTGAIDPLDDVADVAAASGMWMHVDAAYGGFFQLTERGRQRFAGIARADSVTLDPHKGLFLPYGIGSLVVRDGAALRDAHYEGAAYLQDLAPEGELPNFTEYSPELSRPNRGLRVWMPLKLHGVAAFREALDEKLDLTDHLHDAFRQIPQIEIPWEPQLTVVPFRLARRRRGHEPSVPGHDQRVEARVPVEHAGARGVRVARVHRQPPDASRPDRRVHRDRRERGARAGGSVSPCRRCRRSWRWPNASTTSFGAPRCARSTCCSSPR